MESNGRILLVDDEPDLLDILGEFLEEQGYSVVTAQDGIRALEILGADQNFDLLLSDINMPRMKGFELIHAVRKSFPNIITALITAYDINSYIELANKYNIGNIIAKTSPFNFPDLRVNVKRWITGEIFGVEKYFSPELKKTTIILKDSKEIEPCVQRLFDNNKQYPRIERIKTALREIVVNAVYYGAKHEDGARKDEWILDVELQEDEYVTIEQISDDDKIGISIMDQKGRLKKSDVLYWLERNIVRNPKTGLIKSLDDEHGRGLFISREFIDTLIINIDPNKRTEVILINYLKEKFKGYRPLIINEL